MTRKQFLLIISVIICLFLFLFIDSKTDAGNPIKVFDTVTVSSYTPTLLTGIRRHRVFFRVINYDPTYDVHIDTWPITSGMYLKGHIAKHNYGAFTDSFKVWISSWYAIATGGSPTVHISETE